MQGNMFGLEKCFIAGEKCWRLSKAYAERGNREKRITRSLACSRGPGSWICRSISRCRIYESGLDNNSREWSSNRVCHSTWSLSRSRPSPCVNNGTYRRGKKVEERKGKRNACTLLPPGRRINETGPLVTLPIASSAIGNFFLSIMAQDLKIWITRFKSSVFKRRKSV